MQEEGKRELSVKLPIRSKKKFNYMTGISTQTDEQKVLLNSSRKEE